MTNDEFPLYDVPWLVRDPNEYRMSEARHRIELRNQAVVDEYFIARSKGLSASDARQHVADKFAITTERVMNTITWFYNQARNRRKYDFLVKFAAWEEQ